MMLKPVSEDNSLLTFYNLLTLVLPGTDDERSADLINASVQSSAKPQPEQSNGFLQRISRHLPLNPFKSIGSPTARNVENLFPPKDSTNIQPQDYAVAQEGEDEQSGGLFEHRGKDIIETSQETTNRSEIGIDGEDEATLEAEEARSTLTNVNKRKRDIYEVDAADPEHLEEEVEAEEPARKTTKRPMVNKKAKPAILWRGADHPATTQRETRASARAAAKKPEPGRTHGREGQLVVEIAGKASEPKQKRGRGRPSKPYMAKRHNPEVVDDQPLENEGDIDQMRESHEIQDEEPDNEAKEADYEEAPQDKEHGISDILLDPSPVKPTITASKNQSKSERISQPPTRRVNGTSSAQRRKLPAVSGDPADNFKNSERAKKAEAWNLGAVERDENRLADEERERVARRREASRISRQQQAAFEAKLKDTSLAGILLRRELERVGANVAQRPAARSSQRTQYTSIQRFPDQDVHDEVEINFEDDPFEDGYEPASRMTPLLINASERSPFGIKNSNKRGGPKPLSDREKGIFIYIMRVVHSMPRQSDLFIS